MNTTQSMRLDMYEDAIKDDACLHYAAQAQKLIDVGLVSWMTADMREAWLCENTYNAAEKAVSL